MMKYVDIVNELSKLDLASYPTLEATDLIRKIDKIGVLVYTMKPGKLVTRARAGVDYLKSDLSYKPQSLNNTYQRASTPNSTMFYGTIVDRDDEFINSRAVAIAECSRLAREGKESKGIERITFGRWKVIDDIQLIAIIPLYEYIDVKNNNLLTELRKVYTDFIRADIKEDDNFQILIDFISSEFCKKEINHDSDYLLSAVFSEVMTSDFSYDGVLYPSVRMNGDYGFNVAIKPEAVDLKLELDIIGESSYYKNKDISLVGNYVNYSWNSGNNKRVLLDSKSIPLELLCKKIGISSLDQLH